MRNGSWHSPTWIPAFATHTNQKHALFFAGWSFAIALPRLAHVTLAAFVHRGKKPCTATRARMGVQFNCRPRSGPLRRTKRLTLRELVGLKDGPRESVAGPADAKNCELFLPVWCCRESHVSAQIGVAREEPDCCWHPRLRGEGRTIERMYRGRLN